MIKNYQNILREVYKKIGPTTTEKEKLEKLSEKVLIISNKFSKKVNAKSIIAGSLTRDTWLTNKKEFDIFIIFPKKILEKKLEKLGLNFGKKIIKEFKGSYKIEYAQHPYIRGIINGIQIDIVPCYEIKSGERIKSAVDRTPLHVEYLNKHITKDVSDDVRLLKQFCTANKIYGADAKTEGFSGYVCELLLVKYRKFINLLKNVIEWKPGEIIDIENYYNKNDYPKLRKIFKEEVLIIIDPTDKTRNAAAAISANSFFTLKKMANVFLKDPSDEVFFEEKIEPLREDELIRLQMKRRTELLIIKFKPPKVVSDILWPQLRRFADRLENILKENEYEVLRKDIYTNEKDLASILLEMQISKLPTVDKRIGPSVFDLDDSERFLKKYKKIATAGPFIEKNYWCVEINRNFTSARDKLLDTLEEKEKILIAKGIPSYVAGEISKNFEIISETDKIMELLKKDENFGIFLRRHFMKTSLI